LLQPTILLFLKKRYGTPVISLVPPSVSFPVPAMCSTFDEAREVKNTAGQRRPLAVWLIPLLLLSCLLACPACGSCRAPGSAPLRSPATPTSTPPAKRAPFHFPKSLNKQSRKQPRSTTGLPQVRSTESGSKPTQQLTAQGGCPVRSAFSWLLFLRPFV